MRFFLIKLNSYLFLNNAFYLPSTIPISSSLNLYKNSIRLALSICFGAVAEVHSFVLFCSHGSTLFIEKYQIEFEGSVRSLLHPF